MKSFAKAYFSFDKEGPALVVYIDEEPKKKDKIENKMLVAEVLITNSTIHELAEETFLVQAEPWLHYMEELDHWHMYRKRWTTKYGRKERKHAL